MNTDSNMQSFEQEGSNKYDTINLQKDDFNERRGLFQYDPYANSGCEMPLTSSLSPSWYRFRSCILTPLHKKLYKNFTVGELLFTIFSFNIFVATCLPFEYFSAHARGQHCGVLLGLILLFTMKNSFFTFLCGIPYERQIHWHKILSIMLYPMVLVHFHQAKETNPYDTEFAFTHQKHSGYLTFGAFFAIFLFSFYPVRKYCQKLFAIVHMLCTPIICLGILAHKAGMAKYALIFILLERVYRVCYTRFNKKNTVQARIIKVTSDIVKITFPKNAINYQSGQYFFLNIPSISFFEWHPFFVSSQPEESKIEFLVKVNGGWTQQLVALAGSDSEKIIINGPYGNLHGSIDTEPYNNFLLISGSVGLAPIKSVAKNLVKQKNMGRNVNRIQLAHTSKESQLSQQILELDEMQEVQTIQIFNTSRGQKRDEEQNQNSRVQVFNSRPDFDQVFQNFIHSLSSSQQSMHRVAVISSCPGKMAELVYKSVNKYSSNYIKLDYYPQSYEF